MPTQFRSKGKGSKRKVYPITSSSGKRRSGMTTASVVNQKPSRTEVLGVMRQRAIQQGAVTSDSKGYNGWTNWDTWETMLLLDNTEQSQKWLNEWNKNWHKKIKAGKFDPEQAEKTVDKYLVPAARGRKSLSWAVGPRFTPDPEIDPKKVNKAEIVHNIISEEPY